ncbi:hypothetical protein LSCM1_02639 [Leishmania martiniquensis]|uniref:Uncharacterized protein n=1 Tax=Leishmania martiniquensis TaxID=1580590 RepID=A0A836H2X7_9TRYP|nr:hypothetical protein LSCM1_02639 [Leishmania martiniquensis]
MWQSRRVQVTGSGESIQHLIRDVRRPCVLSMLSCFTVAARTACRCCCCSGDFSKFCGTKLDRMAQVEDLTFSGRPRRSHVFSLRSPASVKEEEAGIIAEWVPDVLGYHLPLDQREQPEPAPKARVTEAAGSEVSVTAETHGTVQQGRQEVSSVASDTCTGSQVGGGDHQGGHSDGPPFYGPWPNFATSPVLEWRGCLWQWRPVRLSSAAGASHQGTRTTVASTRLNREDRPSQSMAQWPPGAEKGPTGDVLEKSSRGYYLVPFLLCPTLEVLAMEPFMHDSLRGELAAAQSACLKQHPHWSEYTKYGRSGSRHRSVCPELEASLWSIFMPTPVGNLGIPSPEYSNGDAAMKQSTVFELPTFAMIQGEPPMRVGGRVGAGLNPGATRPTPPEEETWDAVTAERRVEPSAAEGSLADPYTHIFCSNTSSACGHTHLLRTGNRAPAAPKPSACDSSSPTFPLRCRNAVGGGLAELFLAVDRYAALIARGELTLSAACWATLCDTKSWWVVQRLRVCSLEVERELLAAAEAHKRWQQSALSRNRTLVGKSSHGICFHDYPFLAQWPSGGGRGKRVQASEPDTY